MIRRPPVSTRTDTLFPYRTLFRGQEKVMPAVEAKWTGQVKALKFGDPYDPATVAGPVISEREAIRIESWIAEAMAKGARRLVGGARQGAVVPDRKSTRLTSRH